MINKNKKVNISFRISLGSELSKVFDAIYYGDKSYLNLLDGLCTRSGYPHNGGSHDLHLAQINYSDLISWLEILCESFRSRCPKITHLYQDVVSAFMSNDKVTDVDYRADHLNLISISTNKI